MKSKYRISSNVYLNMDEGFFFYKNELRVEITAYQERFLKYLILNKNKPCILSNIKAFVYRGEPIPEKTPDFFSQLLKLCPALRERISVQKYELMDIGYRYKLPKSAAFAEFWPNLKPEELLEEPGLDFSDILTTMKTMEKCITPEQKTILRILMLHHDKPLTYQTIIRLSHTIRGENEQPLKSIYEIIKACNELLDALPEMEELLETVYLNTVAYIYRPFPDEQEINKPDVNSQFSNNIDKKEIMSCKPEIIPYLPVEELDDSFYHIDGNIYVSAVQKIAITYLDKNMVKCTYLTKKTADFLNILIQNTPNTVPKETLARKLYGEDYYNLDNKQIDNRLQDTARRLKDLIPEIKGCLKAPSGIGYVIHFSDNKH